MGLPKHLMVLALLLVVEGIQAGTITHFKTWTSASPNTVELTSSSGLQLLHGDETIVIGGSNQPRESLIRQATEAGMDLDAVNELLRTSQPVITTKTNTEGHIVTTTYKLNADGSIARHTVVEGKPTTVSAGKTGFPKLASVQPVRQSAAAPVGGTTVENDWEWVPSQNTPTFRRPVYSFGNHFGDGLSGSRTNFDDFFKNVGGSGTTFSSNKPTFTTSSFGGLPDSWRNRDWLHRPTFDLPPGVTPKTTTKTEVDEQGNTIKTTSTVYSNLPKDKWPGFSNEGSGPVFTNFYDRTFPTVPTVTPSSTTTTKTPAALPSFEEYLRTRTTTTVKPHFELHNVQPYSTTPLPSLEDFLKRQYGLGTNVYTYDLNSLNTTPKTININVDDLPTSTATPPTSTTSTAYKPPVDDYWLQNWPTHSIGDGVYKSDSQPAGENVDSGTKVSTLSTTILGNNLPTVADLDANMQEVLRRAGITDDDLRNANGNSITKKRVAPDGTVFTTTYRVNSVPSGQPTPVEPNSDAVHPQFSLQLPALNADAETFYSHKQAHASFPDTQTIVNPTTTESPINAYLSKVNLTPEDIASKQGELTKTFIDENGRILSATFVLSNVKGEEENKLELPKPQK